MKIFNNRRLVKVKISDIQLIKYQSLIIIYFLILNIIWLYTDPLKWKRIPVSVTTDGVIVSSTGLCTTDGNEWISLAPLTVSIGLFLIYGNYLAYKTRIVPSEYGESKWIGISMLLYLEALIIAIPVLLLSSSNPSASYFVKSFVIILCDFGTVLLIFLPKIAMYYGYGMTTDNSIFGNNLTSSSKSDSFRETANYSNNTTPKGSFSFKNINRMSVDINNNSNSNNSTNSTNSDHNNNSDPNIKKLNTIDSISTTNFNTDNLYKNDNNSKNDNNIKNINELNKILKNKEIRRKLTTLAEQQFIDELIKFLNDVLQFKKISNSEKRLKFGRKIIKTYFLPNAPYEIKIPTTIANRVKKIYDLTLQYDSINTPNFFIFSGGKTQFNNNNIDSYSNIDSDDNNTNNIHGDTLRYSSEFNDLKPKKAKELLQNKNFFDKIKTIVLNEIINSEKWQELFKIVLTYKN